MISISSQLGSRFLNEIPLKELPSCSYVTQCMLRQGLGSFVLVLGNLDRMHLGKQLLPSMIAVSCCIYTRLCKISAKASQLCSITIRREEADNSFLPRKDSRECLPVHSIFSVQVFQATKNLCCIKQSSFLLKAWVSHVVDMKLQVTSVHYGQN